MGEPPRGAPAGASVGGTRENKGSGCPKESAGKWRQAGWVPQDRPSGEVPAGALGKGLGACEGREPPPGEWAHVERIMALWKHQVSDDFQEVLAALVLPLSAWWAL